MSENDMVRELLKEAVGQVPVPESRGSEAVFARAARIRWRRRAAVTGVVAAVVAGGAVVGSDVLPAGRGENVAASPTARETGTGAGGFGKLLPAGVGKVREVSLGQLIKGVPKAPKEKKVGPYDGDYAVVRDGAVGYLTVHVMPAKAARAKGATQDLCGLPHETPRRIACTNEKVPGVGVLTIWQWPASGAVQPKYSGAELDASLRLTDGSVLTVRDWTGFLGRGSQGPLLKSFPLTRAQLRELALKPQLVP
ncbi:hypothetical protein [Streptomyces mangrovisoli]|uniref:Uncharacterized protein n=1 Tax=Streptomyces mangrovisoli TaxID=1428628 RepID=A0A1J4NT72_9ACTN|nr:hypothetical protein [Streptomyces mangrovisoli]OIJ65306.1 hypothetical protein WN71_023775 [Streptomyces mangrovisoli]